MRRLTMLLLVLALNVAPPWPAHAADDDFSADGVALLQRWNAAVGNHKPGMFDEAVEHIAAFTYADRQLLGAPMQTFLAVLSGRSYAPATELQEKVYRLALTSRAQFGNERFLKRATILHTDTGIAGERIPPALIDPLPFAEGSDSPLLATRRMTVSKDGEVLGETESNWNWPFARFLVDQIRLAAKADPFIGDWYHATAAYMFARFLYAEASPHLAGAAKVLPDDPRLLFDRAVYWEVQGLPLNQVLLRNVDLFALQRFRQGVSRLPPGANAATRKAASLDIPMKEVANADAEELFRRALRADAAYSEARVRLGRLLIERKRYDEALGEIRTALAANASPVVRFYAHLFAARAEQALGRLEAAAANVGEAAKLFPGAQSVLLAQSQIAMMRADVAGAIAAIDRLPREPARDAPDDPWWIYRLAAGRDWESLVKQMWAAIRTP